MLLEFRVENYKSFAEEAVFSMCAAPKQKGLEYSLQKVDYKGKEVKAVCSSVVYGPNASGKSNIVGAMDTFCEIVNRGHINNYDSTTSGTPNVASRTLELIPNNSLTDAKPVKFSVKFYENKMMIRYTLWIDIGSFLERSYPRKVALEELEINDVKVFSRTDKLEFPDSKSLRKYLSDSANRAQDSAREIAESSLNDEELFLKNGFKLIFSPSIVNTILNWFSDKFTIIYRMNSLRVKREYEKKPKNPVYADKTMSQVAEAFGSLSNAIGYASDKEDSSEYHLCSLLRNNDNTFVIDAEAYESYGTLRFINAFPLLVQAMLTGGTLVIDEFDASIHPMAVMNIINIFHNDEINQNHAQLIFNTHNPIFLNSNLFRRDEIKFVERDDENHFSTIYALSDFGTSRKNGVRRTDDYMKNYFVNRYGAIKDVDFTSIFERILAKGSDGE